MNPCSILASLIASGLTGVAGDWPRGEWETATPESLGLNRARLDQARNYALTIGGSGLIVYRGKRVFACEDQKQTYDLKSTSKSIGVTLLGIALKDGKVKPRTHTSARIGL